ncbi:DNA translocase FtsK 4TM domain-containing protein, partial [Flavobacteriales bacterium]|nr:DNA translocase FtsK 4TM domain-containing protein [Flavobacteriales bacterium]
MKKSNKENIFKRISSKFKIEDERFKKVLGFLFIFFSIYLIVVFISYLINGNVDQDKLNTFSDDISNFGGVFGHRISNLFLYNWFGISSFIFPFLFFNWGLFL